jgi:hypothetical protein
LFILEKVDRIAPETRREEQRDERTGVLGTSTSLRAALHGMAKRYPGHAFRCDVVFEFEGARVFLETKLSRTYQTHVRPAEPNPAYRMHLLGAGRTSALHDARSKLPRLIGSSGVDFIGMLVIALGSTSLPHSEADIATLARLADLDERPWRRFSRPERASRIPEYASVLIRPYLWLRPAARTGAVAS